EPAMLLEGGTPRIEHVEQARQAGRIEGTRLLERGVRGVDPASQRLDLARGTVRREQRGFDLAQRLQEGATVDLGRFPGAGLRELDPGTALPRIEQGGIEQGGDAAGHDVEQAASRG